MPTQTFFNLPNEKRQKFVEIAIAEFAAHDYNTASITKIVVTANIAKGSVYQYFEDKKGLYLYLIEFATEEKLAFLKNSEQPESANFFDYLRWLFRVSARFDFEHPKLSQLVYRARYGALPFRDEVLEQTKKASSDYIQPLVERGIAQGDINPEIEPDLATYIVNTLGNELGSLILERLDIDPERLAEEGPLADLDMTAVEKIFDDLIQVLEQGMGRNAKLSAKGKKASATGRSSRV
ncbi:MAG: TetR/AcrR family transcriptional regulator, partial [Thermosynechococcaceae cyanobacterium]